MRLRGRASHLYDLTNTYFEGRAASNPKASQVFSGNQSEPETMLEMVEAKRITGGEEVLLYCKSNLKQQKESSMQNQKIDNQNRGELGNCAFLALSAVLKSIKPLTFVEQKVIIYLIGPASNHHQNDTCCLPVQ